MQESLRLIVGLGNPGPEYAATRHNAGEQFARAVLRAYGGELRPEAKFYGLAAATRIADTDVRVLVPTTFMNRSGMAVAAMSRFYRIGTEQLLVAHDELDFEAGQCRFKKNGGHGGHNGLRDIVSALGSREFHRLRIGIGHPGDAREVTNYVLKPASKMEQARIAEAIDEAIAALPDAIAGRWPLAMTRLHSHDGTGE